VGEKQFRNEVRTIGMIQHVNLVRLRGFSSHGSERLLVYDHMPNGSLDRALFTASPALSWRARFQIALGAARGLLYLHEGCRDCIIHCDIKPENILLDVNLVPKVADFGMAKLLGRDFSRVLTTVRGTIGYLAPEWISGVPITAKADVYSYGSAAGDHFRPEKRTKLGDYRAGGVAVGVLPAGGREEGQRRGGARRAAGRAPARRRGRSGAGTRVQGGLLVRAGRRGSPAVDGAGGPGAGGGRDPGRAADSDVDASSIRR